MTKQYDAYSDLITFTRASTGTALRHVGYGAELVTNGTFDADTDWSYNSSWVISGGLATHSATAFSSISQPYSFASGSVYEITYTLSDYSAGNFYAAISSASGLVADQIKAPTVSSDGTYSFVFVANSTSDYFGVIASATAVGSIDNISVKEVIFDRATDPLVLFNHPTNTPLASSMTPTATARGC